MHRLLLALSVASLSALVLACAGAGPEADPPAAPAPSPAPVASRPKIANPYAPATPPAPAPAPAVEPDPEPEPPQLDAHYYGRWKIVDDKGVTATWFDLRPNGDARKSHAPDVAGIWHMHQGEVRIFWNDGYRDVLKPRWVGLDVYSYAPGVSSWDELPAEPTRRQRAGRESQKFPPIDRDPPPAPAEPPTPPPKKEPFVGPPVPIPIPTLTASEARAQAEDLEGRLIRLKGYASVHRSRKGCWAVFEERGIRLATVVIANGDDPSLRDLPTGGSDVREVLLETTLRGVVSGQLSLTEAKLLPLDSKPGFLLP